jgi:sulfur-carrier protein
MNVNFYATLRDVTGQKTVDMDLPENATVRQLVDAVITRFPRMRDTLLQKNGDLWGHVHVFVNGRDTPFLNDQMDTILKSTDTINIFPAVGGG